MPVSYAVKLSVAMASGGVCAFKGCQTRLHDKGRSGSYVLGEAAHIYGDKPGSERYDPNMDENKRNSADNIIYLCPTCHTRIDKPGNDYSPDTLISMKREHEDSIKKKTDEGVIAISFSELDVAAKALMSKLDCSDSTDTEFKVITVDEKINKNDLSDDIKNKISMGLSQSGEVEKYLANMATICDPIFPERLRDGLKSEYLNFKKKGFSGDDLFNSMLSFCYSTIEEGSSDKQISGLRSSHLVILSHFFHLCEIFEK